MPFIRRLSCFAVGAGLLTYAKCKDEGYKDRLKLTPIVAPGPRIAVIGAGVGGTSCAYFLRNCFKENVTIDIYEAERVGGRTAVVPVNGEYFEAGASIIHSQNRYLVGFTKLFGLERRPSPEKVFGMSDGNEIYFTGSNDYFITIIKLLWRYGMDVPRILFFIRGLLSKFERLYQIQDQGLAFTSSQDLLHAGSVDFVSLSQNSLRGILRDCGFGNRFIEEVAMAAVRNNYGQDVNEIHGLAGIIALLGVGSDLWAVKGGNYLIPENLLKHSKANLIKSTVKEVKLLGDGQYEVAYENMKPKYDVVILAAPQNERNELKLSNFGRPIDLKSPYERIVTHLVRGTVNKEFFKRDKTALFPTELTITNPQNYFNTLNVNVSVQGSNGVIDPDQRNVWKMFARRQILDSEFEQIFTEIKTKTSVDWLAYPHFVAREKLPSFLVHRNFYYLNALERAGSAMEMAAIAGRNVALLIYNEWRGDVTKIDNDKAIYEGNKNSMMGHLAIE